MQENEALQEAFRTRDAAVLARFLLEDWHESHEDIVFELGLIGDPCTIDSIADAVHITFGHLIEWGGLPAFQRKCAYALARIGTTESLAVLQRLAENSDPYLKEYGEEGLEYWPLPYREYER